MLFNSRLFIFLFLPLAVCGYFVCGRITPKLAALWLITTSIVFYAYWNPYFVFVLIGSIAFNYTLSGLVIKYESRPALQSAMVATSIAGNLLLLFYFKYFFPLLAWLASLGVPIAPSTDSVLLPLGISFFTFTQIGYLMDCSAGGIKDHRLRDYVLFVTFFPHLIAGPILHHREMMPQFARPSIFRFNLADASVGLTLFVIGLAKKSLIADNLSAVVAQLFNAPADAPLQLAWIGALAYSLQLYFDFSGYSDMAIGLARIFGIRFPNNFNSPYKATCIIDFWQRWHMTLTRYLTAYLYNPAVRWVTQWRLAHGLAISRKATMSPGGFLTMIALPMLYTMVLAGVWHGAGWQFLIFGILHGSYLIANHAWRIFCPRSSSTPKPRIAAWAAIASGVLLTYFAVLVAEIFFRAGSVGDALQVLAGMSGLHPLAAQELIASPLAVVNAPIWILWIAICFGIVWMLPNSMEILARYEPVLGNVSLHPLLTLQWRPTLAWGIAIGFVAITSVLSLGDAQEFLYFQF